MKKVFIWIGVGIGVFVVLIVIIFAVLSYLNPVDEIVQTEMSVNNISTTNNLIEKKEIEIDSLKEEVNNIKSELFFTNLAKDSLNEQIVFLDGLINGYKGTVKKLNDNLLALNNRGIRIKELAKTYESMKAEEMRPILDKVDDETVIVIYKNMSSRNRKTIIKALSYERAAAITQRLAGVYKG